MWLYREQLTQAGVIEALFETFDGHLKDQGYLAMGGQIIDASIVAVPKQRNSREENARIKAGETPESWQDKPAKRRQKDVEARWTKKHGNKTRSSVRVRVEHVFGAQSNDMGGTLVRSVGLARAKALSSKNGDASQHCAAASPHPTPRCSVGKRSRWAHIVYHLAMDTELVAPIYDLRRSLQCRFPRHRSQLLRRSSLRTALVETEMPMSLSMVVIVWLVGE